MRLHNIIYYLKNNLCREAFNRNFATNTIKYTRNNVPSLDVRVQNIVVSVVPFGKKNMLLDYILAL
jgi:hypothetical protein